MPDYQKKLAQAEARLQRLEAKQRRLDAHAIPGPFVTGNSGIPARRRRKLDQQLDRTTDLAVQITRTRQDVLRYRQLLDRAAQPPRPRTKAKPAKTTVPWSDRLFVGVYPTGLIYCDCGRTVNGDYPRLAILFYADLRLQFEQGVSARWQTRIKAHASQYHAGDIMPVSTCGQTITWGTR